MNIALMKAGFVFNLSWFQNYLECQIVKYIALNDEGSHWKICCFVSFLSKKNIPIKQKCEVLVGVNPDSDIFRFCWHWCLPMCRRVTLNECGRSLSKQVNLCFPSGNCSIQQWTRKKDGIVLVTESFCHAYLDIIAIELLYIIKQIGWIDVH